LLLSHTYPSFSAEAETLKTSRSLWQAAPHGGDLLMESSRGARRLGHGDWILFSLSIGLLQKKQLLSIFSSS
jgi:hypothetical protein